MASERGDISAVGSMLEEQEYSRKEFHWALFRAVHTKQYDVVRLLLSRPECDMNYYFVIHWSRRPFWEFDMIDLILSHSLVDVNSYHLYDILIVGAEYNVTMTVKKNFGIQSKII